MNYKQKFEENHLLGCIKYENKYNLYLMPIAWWILNYEKYDPSYDPDNWEVAFRDNVLNVTDFNVPKFISSISLDKIDILELNLQRESVSNKYFHLYFFIDFDSKKYVNGFYDLEIEEYLPDSSWEGCFGNPTEHLPKDLRKFFEP